MELKAWRLVQNKDLKAEVLTMLIGYEVQTIEQTHPNFSKVLSLVMSEEPDGDTILDLISIPETLSRKFEGLTNKISICNNQIFYEGEEINNTLTETIIDHLTNGEEFSHLVEFMDGLMNSTSKTAKESLFDWMIAVKDKDNKTLEISPTGAFYAYKAVHKTSLGEFYSINTGYGIVNGEEYQGHIGNNPGDVVEVPRSYVIESRDTACAQGLHCGTLKYAKQFAEIHENTTIIKVLVLPEDVVSVPFESANQKIRVRKYTVIGEV